MGIQERTTEEVGVPFYSESVPVRSFAPQQPCELHFVSLLFLWMEVREMVIEVNGLPDIYDEDSMIDKLTIHFMRRCNKGGDVLKVFYPTSTKGQALIVFEAAEVPGVLEHTHVLEVQSQFFPLDVKRVNRPQIDMQCEASLDMKLFCNHEKVHKVLNNHGFEVSETRSGLLRLQGSFLKLQLIYPKLMQLLAEETKSQRTSSFYSNGSATTDSYEHNNVTLRRSGKHNNSKYATSSEIDSDSPKSPMAFLQTTSEDKESSSSESSFSSPPRSYEHSRQFGFQNPKPSASRNADASFLAEPDVMDYIVQFKEDSIEQIKSDFLCNITYDSQVESRVVKVTLSGGNFEEAAKVLSELVEKTSKSLRTQEIDLKEIDSSRRKYMIKNADLVQKTSKVLIRKKGNNIKVIGMSLASYEAKQMLLGPAPSKPMQRNVGRRSSSLPRYRTRPSMEDPEFRSSPGPADAESSSFSSSRSQMHSVLQQEVQQERGRSVSKSTPQQSRAQSAARLKDKPLVNIKHEQVNSKQQDSIPSNEVQVSSTKPKMLAPLMNLKGMMGKSIKRK
ncbi:hypothetical protein DNTS_023834 [Danionella cerebrum]|uniref:NID domain-containing protein n=1 Tax=Danionella cerebrum TaxID=2873325 RepID=A0A553QSV8_9TELE|nr:hypothetical protein DNTS_023834 [Danionella translucida]